MSGAGGWFALGSRRGVWGMVAVTVDARVVDVARALLYCWAAGYGLKFWCSAGVNHVLVFDACGGWVVSWAAVGSGRAPLRGSVVFVRGANSIGGVSWLN